MRRVRVTIIAMETQQCFRHIVPVSCGCQQYNKYWDRHHGSAAMCSVYCCATHVAANNMQHIWVFM